MEIKSFYGLNYSASKSNFKAVIKEGTFSREQTRVADSFQKSTDSYATDVVERLKDKYDADIMLYPKKDGKTITVKILNQFFPDAPVEAKDKDGVIATRLCSDTYKCRNEEKTNRFIGRVERYLNNPDKKFLDEQYEKKADFCRDDELFDKQMREYLNLDKEAEFYIGSDPYSSGCLDIDSVYND